MNIMEQILKKIEKTQVIKEPFDHIIIDDLLPSDFYDNLSCELDNGLICKRDYIRGDYGGPCRFAVDITDYRHWLASGRRSSTKLHRRNYDLLSHSDGYNNIKRFLDLLIENQESFYQLLCSKMSSRKIQDNYFFHTSIVQDIPGYGITPHTDDKRNIFTILFYAPATHENKQFGLRIGNKVYPKVLKSLAPPDKFDSDIWKQWVTNKFGVWPHSPSRAMYWSYATSDEYIIEEPTTIDFMPNRMIVFAPCARGNNGIPTWHAVPRVTETLVGTRNSFQMFFYRNDK